MGVQDCSRQEDCSLFLCELPSLEQFALGQEGTAAIYSYEKRNMKEQGRVKASESKLEIKDFAEPLMDRIEAASR